MARKMKDSGIEWIGEIPEGWEVIKAKYLFAQRNEKGNSVLVLLSPTQKYGVIPQSQLEGIYNHRINSFYMLQLQNLLGIPLHTYISGQFFFQILASVHAHLLYFSTISILNEPADVCLDLVILSWLTAKTTVCIFD